MKLSARLRTLERMVGPVSATGRRSCPLCRDGAAPGPVAFRFAGVEPAQPAPACRRCGREHATLYVIRVVDRTDENAPATAGAGEAA